MEVRNQLVCFASAHIGLSWKPRESSHPRYYGTPVRTFFKGQSFKLIYLSELLSKGHQFS